jgi:O-antigen biosynthesis protein
MITVHVLTLTWNGADKLSKLLPSLEAVAKDFEQHSISLRWHIRDNGSNDSTREVVSRFKYDYSLSMISHNRASFAVCVNQLWKDAKPEPQDLILLLNNDIWIKDPTSIRKMIDLQKKTNADVVGARLLYNDTNKLQHAGVIFSRKYNTLPYHYRPGEESDKQAEKDRYFQAVTAACCLVTQSSFDKIGGMDEGFMWSFDDIDMCLQIGQFGKIAYCGGTTIYHEESSTLKKNPVNKMFMQHNVNLFRKKWTGKYVIDHDLYLENQSYLEIK